MRSASEAEVLASFLRGEIESPRWREALLTRDLRRNGRRHEPLERVLDALGSRDADPPVRAGARLRAEPLARGDEETARKPAARAGLSLPRVGRQSSDPFLCHSFSEVPVLHLSSFGLEYFDIENILHREA